MEEECFVTIKEIAQKLGWEYDALVGKIQRTPVLTSIWRKINKKRVSDNSVIINENIKNVLNQAIKNQIYLSVNSIAKQVRISIQTCYPRIYKNSEILNLWKQVRKNKNEHINTLEENLKEILTNCIVSNTDLTINNIANIIGIPSRTIEYRIRQSEDLYSIWKSVKNIEIENLKSFHSLKKNEVGNEEIKKKLNLDDEKYANLETKNTYKLYSMDKIINLLQNKQHNT